MISFRLIASFLAVLLPSFSNAAPLTLPWTEDFEQTSGAFTPSSATAWKWGTPTAGPGTAHSGTQVWGTNLTGPSYLAGEDSELRSPELDLTAAGGKWVVVHWWQWLVTEGDFDQAYVEVSKDAGGTWETVFGPRTGAANNTWTQHTVLLDPSYASAKFLIRFRLISDPVGSQGGFYVDDLRITAATLDSVVSLQDFELSDGGYVASGENVSWAYGEPISAPGGAASGQKAWATNLDGHYNANEKSELTSPAHNLTSAAGKQLVVVWKQFFLIEAGSDFGFFEVSNDNGVSWAPIQMAEPLTGGISPDGWMRRHAIVDSSYATAEFRLRFRLSTDQSFESHGIAIDDVEIFASTGLTPAATPFAKATFQNVSTAFAVTDFADHYVDNDGGELKSVAIVQLPTNGILKLGNINVAAGQVIPANVLTDLTYTPQQGFVGADSFLWRSSNFFGPSNTVAVSLDVQAPTPQIAILQQPLAQTVNPGAPVTLSVQAVSSLPVTYRWRKNGSPIDTATASSLVFNTPAETDDADYDVVITNSADEETSVAVRLSVNNPVTFSDQPSSTLLLEGNSLTLSVAAQGTGRLDYQWLKDNEPIPGATFPSFTITDAEEDDGGSYQCEVTNIVGPVSTTPATITIGLKPRIVAAPIPRGIVVNGKVVFTVEASGLGPLTYQWLRNGVEIPGATSNTLTLDKLQTTSQGGYSVRVTNGFANIESESAELKVFQWSEVAGIYQDVLETVLPLDPAVTPYPARLTITIAAGGSATGILQYRGLTHRFRGRINSELLLESVIVRRKQSPLNVRLQLNPTTRVISAVLTHEETSGAFRSEGILPQHKYHAKKNPAPQAGRYTILFQAAEGSAGPAAPAWLTANVTPAGLIRLTGELPDGKALVTTANVQTTGRVAFFNSLYSAVSSLAGEVCGRLTLPGTPNEQVVEGDLAWRKPQQAASAPLPNAFLGELTAVGSRYVAPTSTQPFLALPLENDLLQLQITGQITDAPLQRWIQLAGGRQFLPVPVTAENIKFSVIPADGRVTGQITDPTTKKIHKMRGVILPAQVQIGGILVNPAAPGAFLLKRVP